MFPRLPMTLVFAAFALTACTTSSKHSGTAADTKSAPPPTTLWYVGDVEDVIAGRVPPEAPGRWIDAKSFLLGFESGSPEGIDGLGEFLAVNGTAYAKSTDMMSPNYYKVAHGPRLVTTGAVFLPPDSKPAATITHDESTAVTTMTALYDELYHAAGNRAYVVAGFVEFDSLETLSVSQAPIYGQDLFKNKASYYQFGPQKRSGALTYLVGCAADFTTETATRRDALNRILYHNPYDTGKGLAAHAHVLVLDESKGNASGAVDPPEVVDVCHLLSQSVVRSARLDVYPIDRLEPLPASTFATKK